MGKGKGKGRQPRYSSPEIAQSLFDKQAKPQEGASLPREEQVNARASTAVGTPPQKRSPTVSSSGSGTPQQQRKTDEDKRIEDDQRHRVRLAIQDVLNDGEFLTFQRIQVKHTRRQNVKMEKKSEMSSDVKGILDRIDNVVRAIEITLELHLSAGGVVTPGDLFAAVVDMLKERFHGESLDQFGRVENLRMGQVCNDPLFAWMLRLQLTLMLAALARS